MAAARLMPFLAAAALVFPAAAVAAAPEEPRGLVRLPSGHVLQVEIADRQEEIRRGYMFREKVSDNEGMVFMMGSTDFHVFWMKNCKVSLDIVWLDENWNVVHIAREVPPCTEDPCPSYRPMRAGRYVLEVRGGLAEKEQLQPDAHVVFIPPEAAGEDSK